MLYIQPLLKSLDLTFSFCNYRQISKLLFLSKILEKPIYAQLLLILNKNSIFDKFQSGFRFKQDRVCSFKSEQCFMLSVDSGIVSVLTCPFSLILQQHFYTTEHEILLERIS